MSDSQFCYGFLIGFLVAGVLGWALQHIRMLRSRAGQASRRQMMVQTIQSPEEVYLASMRARRELAAWVIVSVLLAIGAVILLFNLY